ncbi:VanZ family protein [Devosia algicola]|uniref:VanZ family protein n=1 Tax=Devosia algicola TaxID=3026418 RepID=A0ABY7YRN9_9HYPH|nr:VanZ family protein [Devosia algicola]WDR03684.1 VanZ family protein [Devosia algicola]
MSLVRLLPWVVLLAVAIATLSPIQLRPHSAAPPQVERLLAFALLGVSFALAYRRQLLLILAGLWTIAYLLEVAQNWTPDRHWGVADLAAKMAGAATGVAIAWAITKLASIIRPSPKTPDFLG